MPAVQSKHQDPCNATGAIGALPYFTISGKVYYKASDVREFIKERFSVTTLRQFEKEHCTKKKK